MLMPAVLDGDGMPAVYGTQRDPDGAATR